MSDAVSHGFPPRGNAWKSRDVLRAAAIVFGLYFTLRLLWFANALVLVAFLGVLFGLAISAGVDQLARVRVPRAIGAPTIVLAFFALLYGAGALIAPTVSNQLAVLKSRLPEAQARVEGWLAQRGGLMRAAMGSGPAADTGRAAAPQGQLGGPLAPVGRGAAEATQRDTVGSGTSNPLA
ncbi:MAG TPA: hypothetical protein VFU90_04345, partial [Candidatus Tumulicola sp.]|nr:hypothetical protein [Candidatus Tumulicola sp.]